MFVADGKDDGFVNLARYRITKAVLQVVVAKEVVGGFGKELLLEIPPSESLLYLAAILVGRLDDIAVVRKELGRDFGASIDHIGVDQIFFAHAIQQGIAEGGFPAIASEDAIGVEHHPALGFARIAGCRTAFGLLEIVLRSEERKSVV